VPRKKIDGHVMVVVQMPSDLSGILTVLAKTRGVSKTQLIIDVLTDWRIAHHDEIADAFIGTM